ncbi:probable xyloglucan endotransglucosylase/hydrolase protein 28 [Tanacetum coccineum]
MVDFVLFIKHVLVVSLAMNLCLIWRLNYPNEENITFSWGNIQQKINNFNSAGKNNTRGVEVDVAQVSKRTIEVLKTTSSATANVPDGGETNLVINLDQTYKFKMFRKEYIRIESSTQHSSVNEFVVINIPGEDVEPKQIILDPDDQPMWENAKIVALTPNSAIVQPNVDDNFVINSTHLKMILENKFDGYLQVDPHDHICEFLAICDMFKYESITSWEQMRRAFINRFFPPSLFNHLLLEIRNFSQLVNNDVKNDLEDFKRRIRSMRTVHWKLFARDDGKTTGVLPNKESKTVNQEPQSKTDFEKSITKFLDGQRVTNMFFKNNVNDMILKMKQNEKNFQTKIKNMEIKIDEWSKSQNISLEQTDWTEPQPPPQAQTEQVNAVFTGSGRSDDSPKTQKDPPPPIIVDNKTEKDKPIKTSKKGYHVLFGDDNMIVLKDGKSVHLSLDERTGSGFVSQDLYLHGYFSASIKLPADYTAGVVVAFYMSNGDIFEKIHDEIDFEFLGNIRGKEWRIQTNIYGNGSTNVGREERYGLWFDPTDDYHQYSILWTHTHIIFYVDDVAIREMKRTESMGADFPSKPMTLYATIWDASEWATNGGKYKVKNGEYTNGRNAMDVEDVLTHPEENVVAQLLTDEEIIESVIGINKDDIDEEVDESSYNGTPFANEKL